MYNIIEERQASRRRNIDEVRSKAASDIVLILYSCKQRAMWTSHGVKVSGTELPERYLRSLKDRESMQREGKLKAARLIPVVDQSVYLAKLRVSHSPINNSPV